MRTLRKKRDRSNVFVGFMFLGMGLGWLMGHLVAGLFIGMGLGLIAQELLAERAQRNGRSSTDGETASTQPPQPPPPPVDASAVEPRASAAVEHPETVWERIVAHQGETFHQLKGQAFTYRVEGNAVVPSTAKVRIQKSQFLKALDAVPFARVADVPKDVFGPSYVYAILMDPRIRNGDW